MQTHEGKFQFSKSFAGIFGQSDVQPICPGNQQVIITKPNEENTSDEVIIK